MAQRRFHYEQAFEAYLREWRIPYIAVDEAKRALAEAEEPKTNADATAVEVAHAERLQVGAMSVGRTQVGGGGTLKSFDFVVYSRSGPNLLVDVKGRKHSGRSGRNLDNWVTREDVRSLGRWQTLFGEGFQGVFAFFYWCQVQPPDALFTDLFVWGDRWYALLVVSLADYQQAMKQRSRKWETVCMGADDFRRLAVPMRQWLGLENR